ncbi:MAG TPA: sigma factor-like helix-turn-helix DNA-binding protein, partial [Acidimicrobiales bacterium]|nr:sigma factor-like helix-turn-helix DNA-binding protein [Acidimicrobiales bacterium]
TRRARVVPVPIGAEGSVDLSRFDEAGVWRDPPVPFTDAVEFRADAAPLVAAVRAAIAALPEPQSTVVTLRDVEGLSTEEVARLTGLTPGNVRVVLHRGRARVRAAVEQEYREATR